MNLNDEVIAHIAQILQMAIITGTDVVDHLRMVRLADQDGELFLEEEYSKSNEENIQNMLAEAIKNFNPEGA